jgi:glucosylceramidase
MRWIATTESAPYIPATPAPAGMGAAEAGIRLDGTRHQPWEGAGGCFNELGWDALQLLTPVDRAAVFRDLFHPAGGCRFNLGRVPVGASDYALEWYSHHEHPGDHALEKFSIARDRGCLLPYIRTALNEAPLTLFASPWSPPTWMKHPKAYNFGTLVWTPEMRRTYADYLVKFVQAYRAEGVDIAQMHVQNEPLADQKFPSCKWTGAQLREFIRDDLGPAFAAAGEPCEVWLGTLNGNDFGDDYPHYILAAMTDAACRKHIAGVGIQWASKRMMGRIHAAFPDLRLYQTENECGDGRNTWDHAIYVFSLMQHYIANGARAYVYWNMMLRPGGESTWGWKQNAMLSIDPATRAVVRNGEYWIMRHLSEHVRPGAVRLGLAGSWNGCAFAFANPDGGVVVLTYNPLTEPRRVRVELHGETVDLDLPPRSVHTITA